MQSKVEVWVDGEWGWGQARGLTRTKCAVGEEGMHDDMLCDVSEMRFVDDMGDMRG